MATDFINEYCKHSLDNKYTCAIAEGMWYEYFHSSCKYCKSQWEELAIACRCLYSKAVENIDLNACFWCRRLILAGLQQGVYMTRAWIRGMVRESLAWRESERENHRPKIYWAVPAYLGGYRLAPPCETCKLESKNVRRLATTTLETVCKQSGILGDSAGAGTSSERGGES
jgi:hypothetical protein